MSKLAICQIGYPKILVLENDTVIAITKMQMKKINNLYLHNNECKETNQLLISTIDSCKTTFTIYDTIVFNLKDQIQIYKQGATESNKVITEMVELDKKKNKRINSLSSQNKLLKASTILVLITAVIFAII